MTMIMIKIMLLFMIMLSLNDNGDSDVQDDKDHCRETGSIIVYWTALGYHRSYDDDNDKDNVAVHDYVIFG